MLSLSSIVANKMSLTSALYVILILFYEIIVTGDEPILFGPQTVYVYGREKLWIKQLFSTLVFNDGGRIDKENVIIKWAGNKATIILKGDEQEDEIHYVEFTPKKIKVRDMETK
jgi:hypothetical protein